jgi:matrixin
MLLPALALLPVMACGGGSPTEPSSPGGISSLLQGQTVNVTDGSPVSSLSVKIGTKFPVTSDGSGFFQIDMGNLDTHRAVVSGSSVVERDTRMSATGSRTRVSMIPSSFDLVAFDEMFRANAQLQRWTSRPALVILASVMEYRANASGQTYGTTGEQLTDDDVALLRTHLTEGLALLSGSAFTSFASVEVERPAAGTQVNTLRSGQIVVGRYTGIVSFAKTIGYGLWSEQPDGTVVGGAMYLDRDFDRDDGRRRLLRMHELGHALGYQHVQSRTSIMNPAIGPEPTDFDRAGAIIAFERPVGNKSPDIDPGTTALFASTGEGRWSAPTTPCALPAR